MDGNGRWAKKRGRPRLVGHQAGVDNIRRILETSVEYGIKVLTIYAFSTENWHRPPEEVTGLMMLLSLTIRRQLNELHKNGVQIRHSGRMDGIDPELQKQIRHALEVTQHNNRIILNVAFNYGGAPKFSMPSAAPLPMALRPKNSPKTSLAAISTPPTSPTPI
jgi:undecaprenyl diphosphate synthase